MAVVDVDDDGVVLPFAASILARDLVTAGMPTADALPLARRVGDELASHGRPVVSSAVLGSETARQLATCGEYGVLRRLRVRWWMRTERVPVVIAIGGTSGSGKSTVSQEVAHRLGIDAVVSTDVVRAILRVTLHPEMLPRPERVVLLGPADVPLQPRGQPAPRRVRAAGHHRLPCRAGAGPANH